MKIEVETLIGAPRKSVFDLAIDAARWPEIVSAILKIEFLTPEPVKVGTRIRETRRMFGREATEEMTFAEIVVPERFVLTAHSHGTRYRTAHAFEEVAGGTQMKIAFSGMPESLVARTLSVFTSFLARTIERQLFADLSDIKAAAESGAHPLGKS